MALKSGTRLGPYEILSLIGAGGMGEVYRARDPRLDRDVAIKVLHGAVTLDGDRRRRFELEARAAGALNHPNIVAIFDIGSENGTLYVVQELLEGETLRQRLKGGALASRKALDYAAQAARGLAAAHAKGIIHRDLKPENLFLTRDGRVKILDFGLAKLAPAKAAGAADATSAPTEALGTEPGMVMGTVGYMSPEQVRGLAVDHRSDLFSLGAILFEMLTGKRAFHGASPADTMSAILKEEPPDMAGMNPGLAGGVERVVRHALEKNPDERFHSAQDLTFDLESLSMPSGAAAAARAAEPKARRKAPVAAALAAAAVFAGVFIGRAFFSRSGPDLAAYRFTALATEEGGKAWPAWSTDGKTIAYAAQVDGVYQIFTRNLDQAVPAQITHAGSDCSYPFWSPDNARIFYLSSGSLYLSGGSLWEIGAAGGTPQLRARDVRAAHISPDGKTMALARGEGSGFAISVQAAGGSGERRLASLPGIVAYVRWAPDGASIGVFTTVGEGRLELWVISYPGGHARRAMEALSTVRGPAAVSFSWFPDSRNIVFSGALVKVGRDHLLTADTRTGRIRPLTSALAYEADPALSAGGRRIAFTLSESDQDIIAVPLDGSPFRNVLATSQFEHCAVWGPKGDQFVYAKEHNGTDEIWVYNVRESWDRPLVTAASFPEGHTDRLTEPRFSPDGQRIVFTRVSGGVYRLWLANVLGGPPVPLGVEGVMAVWSPDGNWIAYQTLEHGIGLAKVAAGGGNPIALVPGGNRLLRAQWSPDGNWLTWLGEEGLEIVSADGKRTELLSKETGWQQTAGFSKDGSEIVGIRENEEHHLVVEAIGIQSKRQRIVLDMGPQAETHGFSLAPDGKSFLTTLSRYRGDIWMLEGFPRP